MGSLVLVVPLLAAAAALPESRSFWTVDAGSERQPVQRQVAARLVRTGEHVAFYQEEGYRFAAAGAEAEAAQLDQAVTAFDTLIYPRQVELYGPCPDLDGNGRVIVLLARSTWASTFFWRFDQMTEAEAARHGFRSNQGEVLYLAFEQQGNRAGANLASLARAFHLLVHYDRDPQETGWAELVAGHAPYLSSVGRIRSLWGDERPLVPNAGPGRPWTDNTWWPLFIEYLRGRFGDAALRALVAGPEPGLAALTPLLAGLDGAPTPADLFADFAIACWLNDAGVAGPRFAFTDLVPSRPAPTESLSASRPAAGQFTIGVGGAGYLLLTGDGARPLTLTLLGDPNVAWLARAVHLRRIGPDTEIAISFDGAGKAVLPLEAIERGDAVLIAATPVPGDSRRLDRREVVLRWGVGWVPARPAPPVRESLLELLELELPDRGAAASGRLLGTVERLAGGAGTAGHPIATRYAWSPDAPAVVEAVRQEAERRGLKVRVATFSHATETGVGQEWQNVLIEVPGSDPRRWPIVLAAHWDAARVGLDESYLRALGVADNATGVAVALETASALSRTPHMAPVLVAILAGGYHDAAGGRALWQQLEGRVAAWIELDGVGVPEAFPRHTTVRLEGVDAGSITVQGFARTLDRAGLTPRLFPESPSNHTVARRVAARGVPAFVVRTGEPFGLPSALDTPVQAELATISPEYMVLLTRGLTLAIADLAGRK